MGEWKRVFLNPGRLSLLLLLVLLCTGLFLMGLMDRVGPQEVRRVRETGKYVSSLTEKWSQEDIEDLPMLAQNELDRLSLYTMYYSDWPYEDLPYATDEEADESMRKERSRRRQTSISKRPVRTQKPRRRPEICCLR